ncbi:MAG: GNAT family N-acetyltransferase, partial [Thermodesulfobacteriota bacterium]|nr:GNAT family N-acetyltransferase [Thermodesulfobacteriota bacterium]
MTIILELPDYSDYYNSKIKGLVHTPFQSYEWACFHEKYFGDKFFFLALEDGGMFRAGLVLFRAVTPYGRMYYSYGRFGTAGFMLNGVQHFSFADIQKVIVEFIGAISESIDPDPLSLSLGSLQIGYDQDKEIRAFKDYCNNESKRHFFRTNHIANIFQITDDGGQLSFLKYNRRSNLSRNLKKAKKCGFVISHLINKSTLDTWHRIHLERVAELGGKHWDLSFFQKMLEDQNSDTFLKFFGVCLGRKLVGGAFCIFNNYVLDIFMMSTLRQFQKLGANHLLTEQIYTWCIQNGIQYVNWQGSNPPNGGVAMFKRQWMAEEHAMHSLNIIFDQNRFDSI